MSQHRDPTTGLYVNPWAAEGKKRCGRCGEVKPLDQFHRNRRNKDGTNNRCRPCAIAATKEWRQAHPDIKSHRRTETLALYGLTPEEYAARLEAQDGRCALCRRLPKKNLLAVDHDHETGEVRGLLCTPCNSALGRWGDNEDGLRRVVAYLRGEL